MNIVIKICSVKCFSKYLNLSNFFLPLDFNAFIMLCHAGKYKIGWKLIKLFIFKWNFLLDYLFYNFYFLFQLIVKICILKFYFKHF